jgi:hypothetical protein
MVRITKGRKELFSYLDLPKMGGREPVKDMVVMTVEFMRYQGEVAYEIGKRQAIALTSTATTIGIGWSAFFFGLTQEAWFTSSAGLMLVFAGTYLLGFWTPKVVDKMRQGLVTVAAAKFYNKWLSDSAEAGAIDRTQ